MDWNLIVSGPNTGKYNMEFDLDLVNNCDENSAYLRFYQWEPYCISLGANQSFEDINEYAADKNNIEVVKRPTGGRAILHAEELTYSVVMPLNKNKFTAKQLYEKISLALVDGLKKYSFHLNNVELENQQPHFPSLLKQQSGVLCFASTAKSEVKFEGKKLIGSAQRKMGDKILQHGSILCGDFHRNLPKYLNVSDEIKPLINNELDEHTTEIEKIIGNKVDYQKLTDCLVGAFEKKWGMEFLNNVDVNNIK
jgi:lipoate-protein ligase A